MGFRFRKSFNLGLGFKVNLSKSGIGYSWGFPGYRITKTANGRTRKTYSIPGTGIGYVDEKSNKTQSRQTNSITNEQKQNHKKNDTCTIYDENKFSDVQDIESAKMKNFQPAEYKDFLRKISFNFFIKYFTFFLFLGLFITYLVYKSSSVWIFLGSLISLLSFIILKIFARIKIEYDFEDESETAYQEYVDVWKELKKSNRVWQISRKAKVVDTKNMYGAKDAIERNKLKISFRLPWYLKSNISAPVLYFKKVTLILLPDKVLIISKFRAGAVNQKNVNMRFYNDGFIEDEAKPKDSEIITQQWLHPNKSGGPDQRYRDNRQLPVYRYSYVDINSPEGINELVMVTNTKISERLSSFYQKYIESLNL
jgi:hypothetical protein